MEKGAIHKISQDTQNENIAFIDEDGSIGNVRIFLFNSKVWGLENNTNLNSIFCFVKRS